MAKPTRCHVLNIDKNNHNYFDFKINNTKLFKDLGIFIADNLKWNRHIYYIYTIASATSFQVLKSFKTSYIYLLKSLCVEKLCGPKLE